MGPARTLRHVTCGEDQIDLQVLTPNPLQFVGLSPFDGSVGQIRHTKDPGYLNLLADLDGDLVCDLTFALNGLTVLTEKDLLP